MKISPGASGTSLALPARIIRIESHSNSPLPACFFSSPRYDGCVSRVPRDLTLPELSAASSAASPVPAVGRGRLLQILGIWFGMAVAIGNAIAAGIVRTPGEIAKLLPNAWLFLGVWVAGGLYALFGASSMAELGAAIPRSGGQYNFSRRALGDYAGFIVGWSDWLSTCGTAAVAIVIAEYSGHLFPVLAGHVKIVSAAIILGFGILQWRGIRWGSSAQLTTGALKTAALIILIVACFILGAHARAAAPAATAALPSVPAGWPLAVAIVLGLQAVVFTVDGWDGVIYFGEEVCEPGRDIPRAIFGSVFIVMAIYLLLNLVALYLLPLNEIAGNDFVLGTVADRVFGRLGDPIIRSIMIISMLSCVNSNLLFSSRTLHAMSCDGLFFRRVARVNPGGTPALSLFLSTLVSLFFVLGSFLRDKLYAHVYVALCAAHAGTADESRVSRVGLSVDDRDRAGRIHFVFDRLDRHGPGKRAARARHDRTELSSVSRFEVGVPRNRQQIRLSAQLPFSYTFSAIDLACMNSSK